jgi:hypothetical protein
MHAGLNEFLEEQTEGLTALVENFRKSRADAARKAASMSAERIKELNGRVRALARSGVKLTNISHGAVQDLIELQADIVGSALTEASVQIERIAYTESVKDMAREQAEVMQAARARIIDDMGRVLAILKEAGGEVRQVIAPVSRKAEPAAAKPATARKPKRKGAKRAAAKPAVAAKAKAGKSRRKAGKTARRARKASR